MTDTDERVRTGPEDDTLVLLNRATLTAHTVRTAVHELNNIFQMVSGYAELLHGAPDLPPSAIRRVESILKQTARGQAILEAVTALTRPEPPEAAVLDLRQIAGGVMEARRYEHTRAGIRASVQSPPAPVRVRGVRQHVEQMLLNLVLNAEQAVAGRPDPAIDVLVEAGETGATVTVTDSGPGVAADVDPFEAFATSRPGTAAGLGLAAVRLLAARSGGMIDVARADDRTAWRLRLPSAL
jgi:C4-dicarboxylate-specific signal transduction histidine kinase